MPDGAFATHDQPLIIACDNDAQYRKLVGCADGPASVINASYLLAAAVIFRWDVHPGVRITLTPNSEGTPRGCIFHHRYRI